MITKSLVLPAFSVPTTCCVCFLIKGKNKENSSVSLYCQLTNAVCSHDKVPNWPSIVFLIFFLSSSVLFEAFV